MIASRCQFKDPAYAGRCSGVAHGKRIEGREIGPRRIPYGKPLKTLMIHDPGKDEFHRFETFKSYAGKRKIDIIIDRDTRGERLIKGVSATWLMNLLRQKMAMLPEICED